MVGPSLESEAEETTVERERLVATKDWEKREVGSEGERVDAMPRLLEEEESEENNRRHRRP